MAVLLSSEIEKSKRDSEIIQEIRNVIEQQIYAEMDLVRARNYWLNRIRDLDSDLLAEALTYALHQAAAIKKINKNICRG